MINNPSLELFKMQTKKLHFEIINNILEKDQIAPWADELYELLPKNEYDLNKRSLPPCESNIAQLLLSEKGLEILGLKPLVSAANGLFSGIVSDYCLLFQVFTLLGDTRKEEIFPRITKLIPGDYTKFPLKALCTLTLGYFFASNLTEGEKTVFTREALFEYCFLPQKDYDKKTDEQIQKFIRAFFLHKRVPKDLFYTDHTYIQDALAIETLIKQLPEETAFAQEKLAYFGDKTLENLPRDAKAKAFRNAEKELQALRVWYCLRTTYPKPEFNNKTRSFYGQQEIVFNKALFNEINFERYEQDQPIYENAENILEVIKSIYNVPDLVLPRSMWMGLYLLLKELPFDIMMGVFGKIPEKDLDLQNVQNSVYGRTFQQTEANENLLENVNAHFQSKINSLRENKNRLANWTDRERDFLRNLLFICMWEKALLQRPDAMALVEESSGEVSPDIINALSGKTIDDLFASCSDINELPSTLQAVSKELLMAEDGLDFSRLEKDTGYSEDFLIVLFYLSRRESEAEASLIHIINLLRERQKGLFPIYDRSNNKDKLIEENLIRLQAIDCGFKLPHFRHALFPAGEENPASPHREGFQLHPLTVHLICEVDHCVGPQNKKDWREIYRRNFDKKYLYKVRNQATHYTLDDNTDKLLKAENSASLLQALFDAFDYYSKKAEIEYHSYVRNGIANRMRRDQPFQFFPLQYVLKMIAHLVQVHCLIIAHANKKILSGEDYLTLIFTLETATFENSWEAAKKLVFNEERKKNLTLESYELTESQEKEFVEMILELYTGSLPHDMADLPKEERENILLNMGEKALFIHLCLQHRKDLLTSVLSFLFSSEILNLRTRTSGEEPFLIYYNAQTSYYLLYLFSHFYAQENPPPQT